MEVILSFSVDGVITQLASDASHVSGTGNMRISSGSAPLEIGSFREIAEPFTALSDQCWGLLHRLHWVWSVLGFRQVKDCPTVFNACEQPWCLVKVGIMSTKMEMYHVGQLFLKASLNCVAIVTMI